MKKKRIIIVILIGVIVSGVILMYSSYALFSSNQISKSAITIKAGTMNGTLKVDGATTNKLTLATGKKQIFVVTLENLNSIEGKFIPYYSGTIPDGVTFGYMEATGVDLPVETTLTKNGKKTYSIYFENNSTSSVTITLGVQGGLSNQPLSLPSNGNMIPQAVKKNTNISNIWKYDQVSGSSTFCVTGEESTCQEINPETFEVGTIIKYKVNDTTEKYFHVISDDGDTLTMQQREGTVYDIAWYAGTNDNTKGPTNILSALENATAGWTNVLDQTYISGTTVFKDNAFTGCSLNAANQLTCTKNMYTLGSKTAKARMITIQEISALGCSVSNQSCPVWVYNYLKLSTSNGGTVDQTGGIYGNNYAYWTSSANSSMNSYAWYVDCRGRVDGSFVAVAGDSARAVVKIEKSKVITPANQNITHVYQYDQTNTATKCITGEESTCQEIGTQDTYTSGTIIKYKVNNTDEKYFHVVSDNGSTLTLQQRENTIYAIPWYSNADDNTKGPTTILPVLEEATKDWTNVLDQTYTLGTTIFKDNAYTGCNYTNSVFKCTTNQYTLGERTAKARMITAQEVISLGCTNAVGSCPIWMYNYLSESTNHGGTVNQTEGTKNNSGYWTMTAMLPSTANIFIVYYNGNLGGTIYPTSTHFGSRAVIEIQK